MARIPKECPLDGVSPILCAGITVYKGLKESGVRPGQTVAVVGAGGGLGSLAQQYAKAMGMHVIAIDTGDSKRDMCLNQLGARAFVDFGTSKDVVKDVQKATSDGLGPHAVICGRLSSDLNGGFADLAQSLSTRSRSSRLLSTFDLAVRWSASACRPAHTCVLRKFLQPATQSLVRDGLTSACSASSTRSSRWLPSKWVFFQHHLPYTD